MSRDGAAFGTSFVLRQGEKREKEEALNIKRKRKKEVVLLNA